MMRGMRKGWAMGVKGQMTAPRVLPLELHDSVMASNSEVKPGEVFDRVVGGDYDTGYQRG